VQHVERKARAGRRRREQEVDPEREVAEGLLLAEYAVRLAVKNQILVDVLGRGADFDRSRAGDQVRSELAGIADEYEQAARRMRHDARHAAWRLGRARHQHDYRAVDRRNLRRRASASEEAARRLRTAAADEDAIVALVDAARTAAWEDVAGEVHGALRRVEPPPPPPPDLDPEERALRQHMVVALDLTALAEERGVPLDAI
jgi:aminopeptidase N